MIPVSPAFASAALALTRRAYAKVSICWTDPLLDLSIVAASTDVNYVSYPAQTADSTLEVSGPVSSTPFKSAHADGNFKPNGTFHPAPFTDQECADYQMGWWSGTRCLADATFAIPPTLSISFSPRPLLAVVVNGDNAYNEFPVDFNVYLYNGVSLVSIREIRGNSGLKYVEDISALNISSCTRMTLEILKWNVPNRVVKITEFFSSITIDYDGDDIISMNILEEMELSDGSLPVGNISANEIDLKLQNLDDRYFPGNTSAVLHNLVKRNRRIKAWLGFKIADGTIEYTRMGTFWSGDWVTPDSEAGASTSGRDRMELLRKMTYSTSVLDTEPITLDKLAEAVLQSAKTTMPDLNWYIDPALSGFTIPIGYFPRQDYMKTLKQIAQACLGQAYFDRSDILQIIIPTFDTETIVPYDITKDDYFTKTNPAKTEELANVITVSKKVLTQNTEEEQLYSSEDLSFAPGEIKTFTFKYSSEPGVVTSVEPAVTDSEISIFYTAYATECAVTATNTGTGVKSAVQIIVNGYTFEEKTELVEARSAVSIAEFGEMKYEFKDNHLVQTREHAQAIADSLLLSYKETRKDTELDWCGNPALVLADPLQVPDYQKNGIDNKGTYYVVKQNFQFDGGLRVKTDGRKIADKIETPLPEGTIYQDSDDATVIWQDGDDSQIVLQDGDT